MTGAVLLAVTRQVRSEILARMCAALAVPILNAGSFRLRPFTLADLDLVREASADPYIPTIGTVPVTFSPEEGQRFIERQWKRAKDGVGYSFVIADARTDHGCGHAGLWLRDLPLGRASVGYWVAGSARGRGAAAIAAAAVADWALGELRIPRVELYIEPWNVPSIRSAEKAGFRYEGLLRSWTELNGTRKDMLMYSRLPADPAPRARTASQPS